MFSGRAPVPVAGWPSSKLSEPRRNLPRKLGKSHSWAPPPGKVDPCNLEIAGLSAVELAQIEDP